MKIRSGVTRTVLLTRRYAIKVPNIRNGWAMFLRGLLSNIAEHRFTPLADQFVLCPVIWSMWGGWLNVMPRCEYLSDQQWCSIEHLWDPGSSDWNGFSCDFKRENFGLLNDRIVLLDYGDLT